MEEKFSTFNKCYLTGKHFVTLDDRNRLSLPNKFYHAISLSQKENKNNVLLFLKFRSTSDRCIEIFPEEKFESFSNKILKLSDTKKENRIFKRSFFSNIENVILDKRHRFILSEEFIKAIGLSENEKEVVFVGVGDYIQLFKASTFFEISSNEAEDFENLEEKIILNE